MELYVETETPGKYGLIDTFINESVSLDTKTTYTQDITAVFKGFTNDFAIQASPNNIKLLGYFGYTDQLEPTNITKRAKLFLDGSLYKEGIIKLQNTTWINGSPSLFSIEFSDGQKNLSEILGEDTLDMLGNNGDGDLVWNARNQEKGLVSVQTAEGGIRWFIPFVSTERIFICSTAIAALKKDNIAYFPADPPTSEDVLLPQEIRPAVFMSDILQQVNKKYGVKIDPTPYMDDITQLTDLSTMCIKGTEILPVKAVVKEATWAKEFFREERFDIKIRTDINGFELNYIGYGTGSAHEATFDMYIYLCRKISAFHPFVNPSRPLNDDIANGQYIDSLEIWEVNLDGSKKRKLSYQVVEGAENRSGYLRARIGLDVFTPEGANQPSTGVKPLISVFVSANSLTDWKLNFFKFDWNNQGWYKFIYNNIQPPTSAQTLNLFESLAEMKTIDFVKSIYTMFGYKKFKDKVLNDFYYTPKFINDITHTALKKENDLTPYADLSKLPKGVNAKYDGYNLKHATSEYQSNLAFLLNNGYEYGQMIFPIGVKPKTEFKIETKFTAPAFNPVDTNADTQIFTFYPFGNESKLNESETRFIYDTITKEFPVFYYNGVGDISTLYGFLNGTERVIKPMSKYHKISHRSNRIRTGSTNYISSLFNTLVGIDLVDQNTLYAQGYKQYIEDTISGKKLIHTIELQMPNKVIREFEDDQEIIIKETKYTVLESKLSLTGGNSKLSLLNK